MVSWDLIGPSKSNAFYQEVYESLGVPPSNKGNIGSLETDKKTLKKLRPLINPIKKIQKFEKDFWDYGIAFEKIDRSEYPSLNLKEITNKFDLLSQNVSSLPIPVQGRIDLLWEIFEKKIYLECNPNTASSRPLEHVDKQGASDDPLCCAIL